MRWQEDEISRLELIKKLFGDFIEDRRGDRVGLILFGSQAYLQAPLTFDRHTVRVWLTRHRSASPARTPRSATPSAWRSSACASGLRKAGCWC